MHSDKLGFLEKFLIWSALMPHEALDIYWFCVFVYIYSVIVLLLLGVKNLKAGAAGEGYNWQKGTRGIWQSCNAPSPGLPPLYLGQCHIILIPPLPLDLLLIIMIFLLLFIILILLLFYGGLESLQALPPLLQTLVGHALGFLYTYLASFSPQVKKYWQVLKYSQVAYITRLWFLDLCHPERT